MAVRGFREQTAPVHGPRATCPSATRIRSPPIASVTPAIPSDHEMSIDSPGVKERRNVASSVVGAAERTTPSCVGSDEEKQPLTSTLYVRVTPSPVGEEGPAGSKRAEHVDGRG